MIPYKTIIHIEKKSRQPLYLQISNQLMRLIKQRVLLPNAKLPSTRALAEILCVHRKTVIASYDELLLQGWIVSIPKKGTFVHNSIPVLRSQGYSEVDSTAKKSNAGFSYTPHPALTFPSIETAPGLTIIKDGVADERLAPTDEIARTYKGLLSLKSTAQYVGYTSVYGNPILREVLAKYLNDTRGLNITKDNILITRGSQMAMFLSAHLLLQDQSYVVVGDTNYASADRTFEYVGASLLFVKVDDEGIDTQQLEELCSQFDITAVYVTPHHHHPTTATLSAQRRMHLLNLAQTYNFAIIEDDYDYDFHYNHAPILPLASHDTSGHVIYIGSFCKTVAPVYRVGYLIAAQEFVTDCAKLRGIVDRQGDSLLELTFAHFIKNGGLDRHIRKVLKIYKARRDLFCRLLKEHLGHYLHFKVPKGGMAVWAILNIAYTWKDVADAAKEYQLDLGAWHRHDVNHIGHNAIRIGFAAYNEIEIQILVDKLKKSLDKISTLKSGNVRERLSRDTRI